VKTRVYKVFIVTGICVILAGALALWYSAPDFVWHRYWFSMLWCVWVW